MKLVNTCNFKTVGVQWYSFIALIHPVQWTIANLVGTDQPTKRQKKSSCVATGWPVPLCIRQVAHRLIPTLIVLLTETKVKALTPMLNKKIVSFATF